MDRSHIEIRNLKAQIALLVQDIKKARLIITELEHENKNLKTNSIPTSHIVIEPEKKEVIPADKTKDEEMFKVIMKKMKEEKKEEEKKEGEKEEEEKEEEEMQPVSKGLFDDDIYDFSQVVKRYHKK